MASNGCVGFGPPPRPGPPIPAAAAAARSLDAGPGAPDGHEVYDTGCSRGRPHSSIALDSWRAAGRQSHSHAPPAPIGVSRKCRQPGLAYGSRRADVRLRVSSGGGSRVVTRDGPKRKTRHSILSRFSGGSKGEAIGSAQSLQERGFTFPSPSRPWTRRNAVCRATGIHHTTANCNSCSSLILHSFPLICYSTKVLPRSLAQRVI